MGLREKIRMRALGNAGGKAGEPRSSRASDCDAAADEKGSREVAPRDLLCSSQCNVSASTAQVLSEDSPMCLTRIMRVRLP